MNIVAIGAHPDDCEVFCGGTCIKWAQAGHKVLVVSVTNGDMGHHEMGGGALAKRRAAESAESARRGGYEALVLNHHDGELEVTLEGRKELIRIIRRHKADVVIGLRSCDYHPDHRNAAIMVQDSAYLVTVPNYCSDTPQLEKNPLYLQMMDVMTLSGQPDRREPFRPHIGVDVGDVMDIKWDMLDAMESQVYEWLAWQAGVIDTIPADKSQRKAWLSGGWSERFTGAATLHRDVLEQWYPAKQAQSITYAEFFEICEYGHQPDRDELAKFFPFIK